MLIIYNAMRNKELEPKDKKNNKKSSAINVGKNSSADVLLSVDYRRGVRINNTSSNIIRYFHS